jgi:hypothetical protein
MEDAGWIGVTYQRQGEVDNLKVCHWQSYYKLGSYTARGRLGVVVAFGCAPGPDPPSHITDTVFDDVGSGDTIDYRL